MWYILHNHKTKDYFPEGTGLLNLSVSTLKEKSHDSQLFSGDTHYNREDYHKNTRPAQTCSEGPLKVPCFLQEEQIFKSSKWGRPRDVYGTQSPDVHGTKDGAF